MSILDIFTSKTSATTTNNTEEDKTSFLGFSAGPTHGLGFTYRKTIGKVGIQGSVLPYKNSNPENPGNENSFYAGGLTSFLILNKGKFGNLYVSLGTGAFRRKSTYTNYYPVDVNVDPKQNVDPQTRLETVTNIVGGLGIGPAIGMEFNFAENFTFSIELPMAFIFAFKDDKIENIKFTSVLPIPNISLLYRF